MTELGQKLRQIREEKGITLEQLQEQTKIQKRYLTAIEEGKYETLPGEFYVKAFIRQYAEAIGMSKAELATLQNPPVQEVEAVPEQVQQVEQFQPEQPQVEEPKVRINQIKEVTRVKKERKATEEKVLSRSKRQQENRPKYTSAPAKSKAMEIIPKILSAIIILGILVAAWFIIQNRVRNEDNQGTPPTHQENGNNGAEIDTDDASPLNPDNANEGDQNGANETDNNNQQAEPEPEPTPEQTITADETNGNLTLFSLENAEGFEVRLTWTGTAYVDVTNEAGDFLMMGQFDAGHEETIDGADLNLLTLNIGNVHNVTVTVNGEEITAPLAVAHQRLRIIRGE